MSIIKLQLNLREAQEALTKFNEDRTGALKKLTEDLRGSISDTINQLLNMEMQIFLGRDDQSENKRNGYRERTYAIKGIGAVRLLYPRDRNGKFNSSVIPANERIDPRIREDLALLQLAGVSTRILSMASQRILGINVSKDTVQGSLRLVEDHALKWLTRPLNSRKYWALYVDGTNFKIQRRDGIGKEPSLVVLGVDENNRRSILAIEPGTKDSVGCWRSVFHELRSRGLNMDAVRLGIMDGLPGLETAFREEFSNAVTARCWVHALKNALNKTPKRYRDAFKQLANKVMYATSENNAREQFENLKTIMSDTASRGVYCLEKDLESLLTHYRFDEKLWCALKTTNAVERVNRELKRRTRSMDTVGERTLNVILAFTALKLEMGWRIHRIDSPVMTPKHIITPLLGEHKDNDLEETVAELGFVN